MLSARQSVAKTVFFAVANGAHCASTAAKLSGQCRPQPNGREGKKPRSYNHSKPACDHQLDKPVALLVPIHLISCSRALKGSSGLTKKAARLCTQSGAHFLLEATMGGMPPYERSVPVAGLASLLFSNEKRASLDDAPSPFALRWVRDQRIENDGRLPTPNVIRKLKEMGRYASDGWALSARRQFVD